MKSRKFNLQKIIVLLVILINACQKPDQPKTLAEVELMSMSVTDVSFTCSSRVLNDGNDTIIEKGVCWSTTNMPLKRMNSTSDGSGNDDYQSFVSGLIQTGVYYVRPYVINSVGISYGDIMKIQTEKGDGKQVIDYDGNIYNTIKIGDQIWLKENSYATHFQNGDNIYATKDKPVYESVSLEDTSVQILITGTKDANYYGKTFTWEKVVDSRNICPLGWHAADNNDWQKLINKLGGPDIAGLKMKEVGIEHWDKPNVGATNESGFTALPGGYNNSVWVGAYAFWWSAGQEYDSINALAWFLKYDEVGAYNFYTNKNVGMTVRCIKNED